MRLSKIRLSGFKSFVDPTTISFPSNLMGIVGPNGCGKSNVIDAIRWVLGEASAKTLRGDSMADVIFNGSSSRKPVGQASIELTFDNSDGTITGAYAGYTEVAVRRVVSRDGTSQYFLNNSRCRRKDITHILLGTGLGAHGYSIIEQGMISRLVEAKPEELRAFLEEAAGISKYKERRRETEHRINHTRDNLERLSDLREELEKQLAHLKRQARAAERYKELKSEERRISAELLALRLKLLRGELASQERTLKERQLALEAAVAAQLSIDTQLEKLRVELADGNEFFNEVQGSYYRVGAEIARLEQDIQHRKAMVQRQRDDLEAGNQQLEEISSHIENDQVELEQLNRILNELNPSLEAAHQKLRESERALADAERGMEQRRERLDVVSAELADTQRAVHVEEARAEQLNAQRERVQREQQDQQSELATITFTELESELATHIASEETLKAACQDASHALESAWRQSQQLRAEDKKISEHLDGLRERLQGDRGRVSSLEALQEAALGKSRQSLEAWLRQQGLTEKTRLAQMLVVDSGWERAVETVLGEFLQAVSVDNMAGLAERIDSFSEGGLALFEDSDARPESVASLGQLAHKVQAPAAVVSLLAGVRTAESLAEAMAVRGGLADGESVVTMAGTWMGRSWLRKSRSDDPHMGVIARAEELDQLRESISLNARRTDDVAKALGATRSRLEEVEELQAKAQTELNRRQQLYADAKTQLESRRARLEQLKGRASVLSQGIESLHSEQDSLAAAHEHSRREIETAHARRTELLEERELLANERNRHQEVLLAARDQAERHRAHAQEVALKVESRRSTKESATAALERVRAQQQHLLRRQEELNAQIVQAAEPLQDEEASLVILLDKRLEVENQLASARAVVEDIDTKLRDEELRRTEQQTRVGEARDAADDARLAAREAQVRAETVAEQFAVTGFDLTQMLEGLPDSANVEEWSEMLERVGKRIGRLGAINLAAIDEYEEQSERKTYLDSQYTDLTDALETLENAIRKIDRETRSRFKDTFDKANQGMGQIFPRLFGGGQAFLELEGDDLLSSGVTVMARPPGKRISTIHLLSGGEKALTAVALVFAIFELNPAPFCLLDEVDAPLDDANVSRFSEIVREMSDRVQFVLITHNKTTMEAMHQLSGVTMHEPGVSRLVAVDIDEAVQLAAM